jgi:tellurite methyltransferase
MDTKKKWNEKYKNRLHTSDISSVNQRLKYLSSYLQGGTALDIACGLGANSLFLGQLGYRVKALDISDVAISYVQEQAKNKQLNNIEPFIADLTDWDSLAIKKDSLDLVIMTYYLDRSIFNSIKPIIKRKGYFFMETFYMSTKHENQGISSQYKLKSKELLSEFNDWEILFYEENEWEGRQTIFCSKP